MFLSSLVRIVLPQLDELSKANATLQSEIGSKDVSGKESMENIAALYQENEVSRCHSQRSCIPVKSPS
jgi:hypothetical protein